MRKFDEQFMNRFMLPLVREITTDMGKGEKNLYLSKLLKGEKLEDMDRRDFILKYFETRQEVERKRPFAEMGEAESRVFWNKFLDGFSNYMILRFRLSGEAGAHDAFCPDKEGKFSQEATNNLYYLSYRISQDLENDRMAQMVKGDTDKEKILKEGNLKLVVTKEGVEKAVSEDSPEAQAEVQADPGFKSDFASSRGVVAEQKYEQIVTKLGDSGLEILPNTFINGLGQWNFSTEPGHEGWLSGEVTDRSGNRLKVSVNPSAGMDDPNKYDFTFLRGTAPNGADLAGNSFRTSEDDLKNFKKKDAFEVAQGKLPQRVREKAAPPLPVDVPKHGLPGGAAIPGGPLKFEASGEIPGHAGLDLVINGEVRTLLIPKGAKAPVMALRGGRVSLPKGKDILKRSPVKSPPPLSPRAKKEALARKNQQRSAGSMAPQRPAVEGSGGKGAEMETSAKSKPTATPWYKSPAAKICGAYGISFGGIGGICAAGSGHAPNPQVVSDAIYLVLHTLGINLLS